jgi:pimeloyl-ACP methyl ester carboxylesterase
MKYNKFISIFLVFSLAHFGLPVKALADQTDPNFCAPAQSGGSSNPVSQMSYDYGPDGLVRFHFTLTRDWSGFGASTIYANADCSNLGGSTAGNGSIVGISHLMVKAVLNDGSVDDYHFQAFNEDTGLPYDGVNPTSGNPTGSSIVAIGFSEQYYGGNWAQSASVHLKSVNSGKTPILIVPGLFGTDIYKGSDLLWANTKMITGFDGFMDPLGFNPNLTPIDTSLTLGGVIRGVTILGHGFHYTDGLINNLQAQGYTEGKDLFTFPYDWRFGASEGNVQSLQGQINYILSLTHANSVFVVAHSTGGLLLKKYIFEHPNDSHVAKAVFVAVPNLGAPLALKVLVAGDNMGVPGFDPQEFKKLAQNMPVVYDLSPSPAYVDKVGSFLKFVNELAGRKNIQQDLGYNAAMNYLVAQYFANPLGVAQNQTLHNENFDNFDVRNVGVTAYNIVGCKSATLGQFTATALAGSATQFNFPKLASGDGTVPFGSAQSIVTDADKTFLVPKISHSNLLSSAGPSQQIVNILTGANLDTKNKVLSLSQAQADNSLCALKGNYLNILSPVEISVTDNEGNVSDVAADGSISNGIPGALYQIWYGHKFVFLPDDDGQQYQISLKGVGTGTATIKDMAVDDDAVASSQDFINVPVTPQFRGQLVLPADASGGPQLVISSGPGAPLTMAPTTELGAAMSADELAPTASGTVGGVLLSPGIYKSSATVTLEGDDENSGLLSLSLSLDGGAYQIYSGPLTVAAAGSHSLSFFATDRAGNSSAAQTINFAVNYKTIPVYRNGSCCGPCCPKN